MARPVAPRTTRELIHETTETLDGIAKRLEAAQQKIKVALKKVRQMNKNETPPAA